VTTKMTRKKRLTIDDLRAKLSANQRSILDDIWLCWQDDKKLITAVALYNKFGKEVVDSALTDLGGSIAFQIGNDSGRKFYQLTFLGILLTSIGPEGQTLISRYLTYVHDRLALDPELNRTTRDDFERDLGFTDPQYKLLIEILERSPFWQGANQSTGTIYVPADVDALATSDDIDKYLEERAFIDYDPSMPLKRQLEYQDPKKEEIASSGLTRARFGVLAIGAYVLYFLYVISSEVGKQGGLYAFKYREAWWIVFGKTMWFLVTVLASLLLSSVLGVERFLSIFPFTRRLSLLKPITTQAFEQGSFDDFEIKETDSGSRFSEETGLGFQLYLDYNDSIKKVYNNAILQYRNSFYFSLIFATVGFGVIFYTLVFRNNGNTNWPAVVVSAVIEAVPALFFYLSDRARKQMIDVFVDLRQDNEVARAYELLRTMKNPDKLEGLKEEIIRYTLLAPHRGGVQQTRKLQALRADKEDSA